MKLAILSPLNSGKAETFIQNHIDHLPFEKVVIYGGETPYLVDGFEISSLFKLKYKLYSIFTKVIGQNPKSFYEYSLKRILKKEKVEAVFGEYLFTAANACKTCKELKLPLYTIALGFEISAHQMLDRYEKKYQQLFEYASNIFIVSEHMRNSINEIGCEKNKIVYTPASASEAFFNIKPLFQNKQVLAMGRFVDKKAPHLTILAFKKVLESLPDAKLIMAGDGPLLPTCKDLVKQFNLEKRITFVGKVSTDTHRELLEQSLIFVQHSRTAESGDSEGTPVAILEASAASLPIVSTKHAGIPKVVLNGESGFLVKENDISAMADSIIVLLKDVELCKKMGEKGKEYVKQNYSLKHHINTISEYLTKVN